MKTRTINNGLALSLLDSRNGLINLLLMHKRIGSNQQEFKLYWRSFQKSIIGLETEQNAIINGHNEAIKELGDTHEQNIINNLIVTTDKQLKELCEQEVVIPVTSRAVLGLDTIELSFLQDELLEKTILENQGDN